MWYECSILCIVWNTDGCSCFCTGGSQCRSDVLYSFDALYDCFLVASGFAAGMGVTPETFHVVDIPKLTIETGLKMGAIAVGCAVISIVFCMVLNGVAGAYGRWFKNPYVRVVVDPVW